MTSPPKKRLGRGLDALLPPPRVDAPLPSAPIPRTRGLVNVADLHPNRQQPRRHFDGDALDELAQSITELGVLEPIVVRKRPAGGFEIISGERRWRAAQRAGVLEVPVHELDLPDSRAFLASLVENLQREDLRPLEVARGYQRLLDDFDFTQDDVAKRVGKSRVAVSNSIRLLKLPASVLALLDEGKLSEGHGRALLQAGDDRAMERLGREAVAKQWSVRETERRARGGSSSGGKSGPTAKDPNVAHLEKRLTTALGMRTRVESRSASAGQVVVEYASLEELNRLLDKLFG